MENLYTIKEVISTPKDWATGLAFRIYKNGEPFCMLRGGEWGLDFSCLTPKKAKISREEMNAFGDWLVNQFTLTKNES